MTDIGKPAEPLVRFSPTVELGHLLQAVVILAGMGGWALVGYQTITKQLDQHAAEMALFKQRITADEAAAARTEENLRVYSVEMRGALTKISDQLTDVRTLVAGMGHGADAPRR